MCVSQLVDRVGGIAFKASTGRVMAVSGIEHAVRIVHNEHTQQRTERKESARARGVECYVMLCYWLGVCVWG